MRRLIVCVPFLFLISCGGGLLDLVGFEESVTEYQKIETKNKIEDDTLADKHPVYDPDRWVTEQFGWTHITMNKSKTITKLDILPLAKDGDTDIDGKLFHSRAAAIAALSGKQNAETTLIPSLETVNGALKPFNDGLYAGIEVAVQSGRWHNTAVAESKLNFLRDLLAATLAFTVPAGAESCRDDAAADIAAALMLAGDTVTAPDTVKSNADALVQSFLALPLFSKPIGFYTWNDTLSGIFKQDRFLQNYQGALGGDQYSDGEFCKAAALALTINGDTTLAERYETYLALYAGLTNPFANYPVTDLIPYLSGLEALADIGAVAAAFMADHDLLFPADSSCNPRFALFPSSKSKETTLHESLFCLSGVPEDVDLLDLFISAIKNGTVNLLPDEHSGWYDYQTYALETLLLPERAEEQDHFMLTAAYKKKLVETFKSIMIQNRETHAAQLELGGADKSAIELEPVDIYPNFAAEPFPTFYLRNGRAYRFLETYLSGVLGSGFLQTVNRLTENDSSPVETLADELTQRIRLLYGLYFLTSDALGSKPALLPEELLEHPEEECRTAATAWLAQWTADIDVNRDMRVIVPVFADGVTGEVRHWAVLGVTVVKASAEWVPGYEPEIQNPEDVKEMKPHKYYLLIEASAEVRRPLDAAPLTRDEFRTICDQYDSVDELVEALEKDDAY
ncbi:MAG TPA: hypothetical protein PLV42_00550 [bacterium]|nr:hypothetical protein [bacterium]